MQVVMWRLEKDPASLFSRGPAGLRVHRVTPELTSSRTAGRRGEGGHPPGRHPDRHPLPLDDPGDGSARGGRDRTTAGRFVYRCGPRSQPGPLLTGGSGDARIVTASSSEVIGRRRWLPPASSRSLAAFATVRMSARPGHEPAMGYCSVGSVSMSMDRPSSRNRSRTSSMVSEDRPEPGRASNSTRVTSPPLEASRARTFM
jgi:hypothetical protein